MNSQPKQRKTPTARHGMKRNEAPAREERHDAGPLAANASGISDRSSRNSQGSAGEPPMLHPSGYQAASGVQPHLDPSPGTVDITSDEEQVRMRAYKLWEDAGQPEGEQDAHWHAARRQIEAERAEADG